MKANHPFLSPTLAALLGLLCVLPAQAKPTQNEEDRGDMEHYHHEYYSHSYVDPDYREDQGTAAVNKAPHHKNNRRYGQPDTADSGVTFAFGGHRRHPRR
ncbi:MAG TPA: hypothetical protein VK961_02715 [Chthoniobacter sp.]|nr:hypothetical protein [Chthoniobacter sp.]